MPRFTYSIVALMTWMIPSQAAGETLLFGLDTIRHSINVIDLDSGTVHEIGRSPFVIGDSLASDSQGRIFASRDFGSAFADLYEIDLTEGAVTPLFYFQQKPAPIFYLPATHIAIDSKDQLYAYFSDLYIFPEEYAVGRIDTESMAVTSVVHVTDAKEQTSIRAMTFGLDDTLYIVDWQGVSELDLSTGERRLLINVMHLESIEALSDGRLLATRDYPHDLVELDLETGQVIPIAAPVYFIDSLAAIELESTGVCCFGDAGCAVVADETCLTLGATFLGAETDCVSATCCVDANRDGRTNTADLVQVIRDWGCYQYLGGPCYGEVTGLGVVAIDDLEAIIQNWGCITTP